MLIKSDRFKNIMARVCDGRPVNKEETVFLLQFNECSLEAKLTRAAADDLMRKRTENSAVMLGQVAVDVCRCPAGCRFCTFGDGHSNFDNARPENEELRKTIADFACGGDLYGLYLMTMHTYDMDVLLNAVRIAREAVPETTRIFTNIGDTDIDAFKELKRHGVSGTYHVCRLGEGVDTKLKPEDRIRTMRNALDAGIDVFTCLEPIGPEHTPEQLADNLFIGLDMGVHQHAAMRRVAVPGTPLAHLGQISELRLAQITAVVYLAAFASENMAYVGVHEPNELGYTSGANVVTAESGYNPRDVVEDTSKGRGFTTEDCRNMFRECGFRYLRNGREELLPLYPQKENSGNKG